MTALQLEGLFFFFFAYLARVHFNKKWWLRQLLPMNIFSFWLGLPHTSTCNFVLKKIRYTQTDKRIITIVNSLTQDFAHWFQNEKPGIYYFQYVDSLNHKSYGVFIQEQVCCYQESFSIYTWLCVRRTALESTSFILRLRVTKSSMWFPKV